MQLAPGIEGAQKNPAIERFEQFSTTQSIHHRSFDLGKMQSDMSVL